ncbi:MAG: L-histidine N(alpha)-methyltransferase [Hyphomicrobiales bacterium]|nr:L-histidine N(alpha)-methyltransferase [Hyphomicrobiales bacterium]
MNSMSVHLSENRRNREAFGSEIAQARHELVAGLSQKSARIAPKYFYDGLGSRLFEAICLTDEYYVTRAEAGIFAAHARDMAAAIGPKPTLIDLGAGNCAKAAGLFPALRPAQYVAVDISVAFLDEAVGKLQAGHPHIPMLAVGADFSEHFALPAEVEASRRVFFYPGSSIGNFTPLEAAQCLRRFRAACGDDGGLLIGVDLVKARPVLEAAYDDALGITSAFNLNVLRHVNALLDSDFDVSNWRHRAHFNEDQSRIEMHLEATRAQFVAWPGGGRQFAAGERIHTENSYKFTPQGFTTMLAQAGFGVTHSWSDAAQQFLVCYARAQ